jgi:hypothetical protein
LKNVRGVKYNFINEDKYGQGTQIGVIAQELKEIYPELVGTSDDGFYYVDYQHLSGVLLQAINEQQVQIDNLEKMVKKQNKLLKEIEKKLNK